MPLAAAPEPLVPDPPLGPDRPADRSVSAPVRRKLVERIRQDIAAGFYDNLTTLDQQLDACLDAILADAL